MGAGELRTVTETFQGLSGGRTLAKERQVSQSHLLGSGCRDPHSPALWPLHVLYQLCDLDELLSMAKPTSSPVT